MGEFSESCVSRRSLVSSPDPDETRGSSVSRGSSSRKKGLVAFNSFEITSTASSLGSNCMGSE